MSYFFKKNLRFCLAFLCLGSAWIFPFYGGPARDAMPQIYMLAMCSVAILLLGASSVHRSLTLAVSAAFAVMLLAPSPYLGGRIAGLTGLALFWVACHLGSKANNDLEILVVVLFTIMAAAFINAAEGVLQWFGLAGNLWPWVVEPENRGIAFGIFRQRNLFATFLVVGMISVIWAVQLKKITKHMSWFLVAVFVIAIAASGSRTGFLEIVSVAVFGVLCHRQQKKAVTHLLIGQFFLYFLATLILPIAAKLHGFEFTTGMARTIGISQDSRIVLWQNTMEIILNRPWTGWGWLETGYAQYAIISPEKFSAMLSHTHNIFLQIAVEFGIPVAITFLIIIISGFIINKPWILLKNTSLGDAKIVANKQFSWLIIFVIFAIHSMLEFPLWSLGFLFILGFFVGYIASLTEKNHSKKKSINFWITFVCVNLLALSLISAEQYKKFLDLSKVPFEDKIAMQEAATATSEAWLFRGYSEFILLQFIEPPNSSLMTEKAILERLIRFSAEPFVIKKLIINLWHMKEFEKMNFHIKRYCIAFPKDFYKWKTEIIENPKGIYYSSPHQINLDCKNEG